MPTSKFYLLSCLIALITLTNCKKDVYTVYEVNETETFPPNAGKDKQKTENQYISILYANLFQKALSANELVEIINCIESIGDKDVVHEIIISNFMNKPDVILPTNEDMRKDLDAFLEETYHRFFVRNISEAERTYFTNYIESNQNITPELVYFAFTLSNEYLFY
ncbi:MAG: hypothetical protein IH946_03355 [Bacteroidetes bacterium]|nr:hypothetical protein [Bacteroidota bacterium]